MSTKKQSKDVQPSGRQQPAQVASSQGATSVSAVGAIDAKIAASQDPQEIARLVVIRRELLRQDSQAKHDEVAVLDARVSIFNRSGLLFFGWGTGLYLAVSGNPLGPILLGVLMIEHARSGEAKRLITKYFDRGQNDD